MKRRDLVKTGLLGIMASSLALSGCNKEEKSSKNSSNELNIIPKQTGVYEFSCPLLFDFDKFITCPWNLMFWELEVASNPLYR